MKTETASIHVEIAPGELFDKISILQIKSERIRDQEKLNHVRTELHTLIAARDQAVEDPSPVDELARQLKSINERLWDIEDAIRDCERQRDFGPRFIELARAVYKTNDRRAEVKRTINERLGSRLMEEKSYQQY